MIKVAIIGLGGRGGMYGDNLQSNPEAKIVAVCDPNDKLREKKKAEWGVPDENSFRNADDFFARQKCADVVLICSPDRFHYQQTMAALKTGYHVQLEKPIAKTLAEAMEIERFAREKNLTVFVCYVLRYSAYFKKIKEIVASGIIGEVKQIQQTENVDYRHYCRSYVRGQWKNEDSSSSYLAAKCSHDMDLLCWYAGSKPKYVTSFADLTFYTAENKPSGATDTCDDCPYAKKGVCRYNAYNTYYLQDKKQQRKDFFRSEKQKKERYAKIPPEQRVCVFSAGNDVMNRQSVQILMENGVQCTFTTSSFHENGGRNVYIQGTKGELYAEQYTTKIKVYTDDNKVRTYRLGCAMRKSGHAGGDRGTVFTFCDLMSGKVKPSDVSCIGQSIDSQILCEFAELSQKNGGVLIDIAQELSKMQQE